MSGAERRSDNDECKKSPKAERDKDGSGIRAAAIGFYSDIREEREDRMERSRLPKLNIKGPKRSSFLTPTTDTSTCILFVAVKYAHLKPTRPFV